MQAYYISMQVLHFYASITFLCPTYIFQLFGPAPDFVCEEHNDWAGKIANRIIINIFFNNAQKESKDAKRKDTLKEGLKKRQRTK